MYPPLRAMEAGISHDERPLRLSRIQDSVRNLLRSSTFGSERSSPPSITDRQQNDERRPIPGVHSPDRYEIHRGQVLPSPSAFGTAGRRPNVDIARPVSSLQGRSQPSSLQSAISNSRAVTALNHPDLSNSSMESLALQKARSRQRHGSQRAKHRRTSKRVASSRAILCVLAAVLLAGLIATYVSIATTASGITTTFHVLFILGILLSTIVFAHAVLRLCLAARSRSRGTPGFDAISRHGQKRRPHCSRQLQIRSEIPKAFINARGAYIPPAPIQVHVIADDTLTDENIVEPAARAQEAAPLWNKEVDHLPNPPPAYGRWRGSVRADPALLHWVPSPTSPEGPALPSPNYEDAVQAPSPSYRTRESAERQRTIGRARAANQVAETEMLEVRTGPVPEVGQAL